MKLETKLGVDSKPKYIARLFQPKYTTQTGAYVYEATIVLVCRRLRGTRGKTEQC